MTTVTVKASHTYDVTGGCWPRWARPPRACGRAAPSAVVSDTNVAPPLSGPPPGQPGGGGLPGAPLRLPPPGRSIRTAPYLPEPARNTWPRTPHPGRRPHRPGGRRGGGPHRVCRRHLPPGDPLPPGAHHPFGGGGRLGGGKDRHRPENGKNLAGAFYQPKAVLCDLDTLATLPEADFADGCAEVIKYGMIGDAGLLDTLETIDLRADPEEVVARCIAHKRDLVEQDEFDTGARQLLNLGHTIGHGVEACSGYQISHGKAVAIGMTLVTRGAVAFGKCPPAVLPRLEGLLARYRLPTATDYAAGDLYEKTLSDKKRAGDTISLVVPTAWGTQPAGPRPGGRAEDLDRKGVGAMTVTIQPGCAEGTLAAVPSKSAAHRLLICAALGQRPVQVVCPQTSQDIEATVRCLNALGADIRPRAGGYDVTPPGPGGRPRPLPLGLRGERLHPSLPPAGGGGPGGPGHLPPGRPAGPAAHGAPDGAAGGRGMRDPSPPPGQRAHHPGPAPAGGIHPAGGCVLPVHLRDALRPAPAGGGRAPSP